MTEKMLGYIFIFVGILVIAGAGMSVFGVFTKNSKPVQLFNGPGISMDLGSILKSQVPAGVDLSGAKTEIVPASVVNDSANLFAHIFLMGFMATIGYRIAAIGAMLVRPIQVKLKVKETEIVKDGES